MRVFQLSRIIAVILLMIKWIVRSHVFRDGLLEVSVHTNNGVKRKNKDFKHQHLVQFRDKSLSGMITVLTEQFLPDNEKKVGWFVILLFTSFKITHHHWPTTTQWIYISKGIMHAKLIFHICFDDIAFSWDEFSWFPRIWENLPN